METVSTPVKYGMIRFEPGAVTYTLRSFTLMDASKYPTINLDGLGGYSKSGTLEDFLPRDPGTDTDPFTGYGFLAYGLIQEEWDVQNGALTAPVVLEFTVDLEKISGTLIYK